MRKAVVVFAVLVIMLLIAADFKTQRTTASLQVAAPKKPCYGYTIIEFSKGINCNGDTVALIKVKGGQELKRAISDPTIVAD